MIPGIFLAYPRGKVYTWNDIPGIYQEKHFWRFQMLQDSKMVTAKLNLKIDRPVDHRPVDATVTILKKEFL
jgi:hypothetical protein